MFEILAGLGALVAGFYLLWRDGLPVLNAYRTGVWRSQRVHVVRAEEPGRFAQVMGVRRKRAMVGLAVIGLALLWLIVIALSIWSITGR